MIWGAWGISSFCQHSVPHHQRCWWPKNCTKETSNMGFHLGFRFSVTQWKPSWARRFTGQPLTSVPSASCPQRRLKPDASPVLEVIRKYIFIAVVSVSHWLGNKTRRHLGFCKNEYGGVLEVRDKSSWTAHAESSSEFSSPALGSTCGQQCPGCINRSVTLFSHLPGLCLNLQGSGYVGGLGPGRVF